MDILCERCGEPWDLSSLNEDMSPVEKGRFLRGEGCPCCYGKQECGEKVSCDDCPEYRGYGCMARKFKPRADFAREAQAAMRTVLGDDLDGLAAEMEDFGLT